jgi:outer membrane protein assembly factor BamB
MKKFAFYILLIAILLTGCTDGGKELSYEERFLSNQGIIHVNEERAPVFDTDFETSDKDVAAFSLELKDYSSELANQEQTVSVFLDGGKNNYKLILQFPDDRKEIHYSLPQDILKPLSFNYMYDDMDFPLYLKTLNKGNIVKYYKVDLKKETIGEYKPIGLWSRILKTKWTYTGEEIQNYITDEAKNSLLVINHDGGISGHHSRSYLTAVDKKSGEEIWSVYAGYMGSTYTFNKNESKVFVGVNLAFQAPGYLYCIEHKTGTELWKIEIDPDDSLYSLVSVKDVLVACVQSKDEELKLFAYSEESGKKLWQRDLGQDKLYTDTRSMDFLVLYNERGITAYDVRTLKQKWHLDVKLAVNDSEYTDHTQTVAILDPIAYGKQKDSKQVWFALSNGFINVNIKNGKIRQTVTSSNSRLLLLDKKHAVIMKYKTDNAAASKLYTYAYELMDTEQNKVLFSGVGRLQGGIVRNNRWIAVIGNSVKCYDLKTRKEIWNTPLEIHFDSFDNSGLIKPVVYKNRVIIPQEDHLMVLSISTGELLYQVADYLLPASPFPNHKPYKAYSDGKTLYVSRLNRKLEALR